MFLFGLGRLVYVAVLITNAIAILSEDRFLARIGWGRSQADPAFGTSYDSTSVKAKTVDLIASVRTVMRTFAFTTCGGEKRCPSARVAYNDAYYGFLVAGQWRRLRRAVLENGAVSAPG
ncbi:Yos1-like-domain-containing protein [Aspergillus tamarii]|uniref:Yos1-like-domain-containing protein n=1 Tax=Aspergillus tamarii TaxID=41984 RepID=A0A5N6UTW2_ASPTM|nr:Yos1-like-domain-containing protein [Aspergillus tamarii]